MATGTPPAQTRPTASDPAVLAILLALALLLATIMAWSGWQPANPWRPQRVVERLLIAGVISGFVGFAELVSRYRDQPWRVAGTTAGLAFIVMNGLAGAGALALLEHFHEALGAPADGVLRVILAGTGAMVILRSKLFSIRQTDGGDVAVGPAFAVDTFLAAVNRDVDRRRAEQRHAIVTANARSLAAGRFATAKPFLEASILAFQTMEPEERDRLKKTLDGYASNTELQDEIKFAAAGFDFLTAFGDRTYEAVFAALADYLKQHPT